MSSQSIGQRQILRLGQVKAKTGLSRSSIYNFIKSAGFPQSVPLGLRAVGWLNEDINVWIESRVALRRQGGAS